MRPEGKGYIVKDVALNQKSFLGLVKQIWWKISPKQIIQRRKMMELLEKVGFQRKGFRRHSFKKFLQVLRHLNFLPFVITKDGVSLRSGCQPLSEIKWPCRWAVKITWFLEILPQEEMETKNKISWNRDIENSEWDRDSKSNTPVYPLFREGDTKWYRKVTEVNWLKEILSAQHW